MFKRLQCVCPDCPALCHHCVRQLLWLKICLFSTQCVCVFRSVLTVTSEYLTDLNNRTVFVMCTDARGSVSRANKGPFPVSCVQLAAGRPCEEEAATAWPADSLQWCPPDAVRAEHCARSSRSHWWPSGKYLRSHFRKSGLLKWNMEYLREADCDGQTFSLFRLISSTLIHSTS